MRGMGPYSAVAFTLFLTLGLPGQSHAVDFASAEAYSVGTSPSVIVVGDFNGDGKLDIAVRGETGRAPACRRFCFTFDKMQIVTGKVTEPSMPQCWHFRRSIPPWGTSLRVISTRTASWT